MFKPEMRRVTLGNRLYCLVWFSGGRAGGPFSGKERFLHKSRKVAPRRQTTREGGAEEGVTLFIREFEAHFTGFANQ